MDPSDSDGSVRQQSLENVRGEFGMGEGESEELALVLRYRMDGTMEWPSG